MASSATVGILRVILTMNKAEFESGAKSAGLTVNQLAKSFKTLDDKMFMVGMRAQSLGKGLTLALTAPIVALGAGITKAAVDFESSFAGVRKTVNATEVEFAALSAGMRALAKTIPINVNELNKIGEAAGQLGIETSAILGFTKVMAQLGVTTNLSSDQAATSLARLANITQMNQRDFDRMGATVVALGNRFASTESEIVDFGLRIAGAGKQAGLSEANILAIGTAMSSVGVEAEAGGTAVQKVLLKMVEASVKGGDAFNVFARTAGMSARHFADLFENDAAGAFQAFVEGLGRQGKHAITVLDQLGLEDQRLVRSFLALSGAGDLLANTIREGNTAWRENSALSKEAGERFKTTASMATLLWNKITDIGITLGNALLPAIKATIGILDRLLPAIHTLAQGFAAMPAPIQLVMIGIAGVAAAAGPLIFVLGQLAMSVGALSGLIAFRLNPALMVMGGHHHAAAAAAATHTAALHGTNTAARGLAGTLAGAGGLVAALGAAAVAYTLIKTSQIRAQADAMFEASKIVKKAITNLEEAQQILAAFEAGKTGQKLSGRITMEMAAAWEQGAKSVRTLGTNAAITEDQIGATTLTIAGFGKKNQEVLPPAAASAKTLTDRFKEFNRVLEADRKKTEAYQETLAKADASLQDMWRSSIAARVADAALHNEFDAGTFKINRQIASLKERAALLGVRGGSPTDLISELTSPISIGKIVDPTKGGQLGGAIASAVLGALQGGGNPLAAAGGAAGSQLLGSLAKKMTGGAGMAIGGVLGGALNAALPIIGSLAGPLLAKVFGGLLKTESKQVNKARDQFLAQFGGFHELAKQLHDLGPAGDALFQRVINAKKMADFEAATKAATAALDAQKQRLGEFNAALQTGLQRVKDLGGGIPDALRPMLDGLREGKRLSEENLALLDDLANGGTVDWRKLEEAAGRYGASTEKLGSQFQAAKLHEAWQQIIDDIDLFERGEVDVNALLVDMADEISALVQKSLKFGTEIPENMRPWIQKLIDAGLLLDESGEKITDIGKLKFGETLQTSLQKLIDEIRILIETLNKVPTQVNVTAHVRTRYDDETGGAEPATAARGGLVTTAGIQYRGLGGPIWPARGTDTVRAMLTPGELILTEADQGIIARGLEAAKQILQSGALDVLATVARPRVTPRSGTPRQAVFRGNIYLDQFGRRRLAEILADGVID